MCGPRRRLLLVHHQPRASGRRLFREVCYAFPGMRDAADMRLRATVSASFGPRLAAFVAEHVSHPRKFVPVRSIEAFWIRSGSSVRRTEDRMGRRLWELALARSGPGFEQDRGYIVGFHFNSLIVNAEDVSDAE